MEHTSYEFRTAVSGFHKGDVIGYIEKMISQHQAELAECEKTIIALQNENRALNQQINLLMIATPLAPETPPVEPAVPQEQPVPVPVAVPVTEEAPISTQEKKDLMWEELCAYRRAEAVEYNANQRVKKLYQQMEDLCDDAMNQFHATDATVKQTIELILTQNKALEQAYMALSNTLRGSREKMNSMNDLLYSDQDI